MRLFLQPNPSSGALFPAGTEEALWRPGSGKEDRAALLTALDHSLGWLDTANAARVYAGGAAARSGIPRAQVRAALGHFRHLLRVAPNADTFRAALLRDFVFVKPDDAVLFTGYYEAVYEASPVPTARYRYPVFRLPPDLVRWPHPHPTRLQLEGSDGLGWRNGPLRALPLAFLADRLEAFLIQVEGSARLHLTDGRTLALGCAGYTSRSYTGIGQELVRAGKLRPEELTLPALIAYFRDHPEDMDRYLPRNERFVFLAPTHGQPARGSLGVPLVAGRSVAADPAHLPPGALALIQVPFSRPAAASAFGTPLLRRLVLVQDVGVAIRGSQHIDLFCGSGAAAQERAGWLNDTGSLAGLFLKPS